MHAHADAVEHTAASGGWVDDRGRRFLIGLIERSEWARDAALLREEAYRMEQDGHGAS